MCGTGGGASSGGGGGGGGGNDKPAKKKTVVKPKVVVKKDNGSSKYFKQPKKSTTVKDKGMDSREAAYVKPAAPKKKAVTIPKATPAKKKGFIEKLVTPTKSSIAKNKIAGAKFTASQKAKGIGVARSNITGGGGKKIGGVANSETNPALVKLAKEGKRGAEGLKELTRQQAAQTGKDTSFKGIYKSLASGEKHAPRQSLLEFGKAQMYPNTGPPSQGFKEGAAPKVAAKPPKAIATDTSSSSGTSNQATASSGPAGASNQPDNLKNMLAVKKNKSQQGKRKLRSKNGGVAVSGSGFNGLNIST